MVTLKDIVENELSGGESVFSDIKSGSLQTASQQLDPLLPIQPSSVLVCECSDQRTICV